MTTRPSALLSFLSFCLICLALAAVGAGYGVHAYLKKGPLEQPKLVLIEKGAGVSGIASTLKKEGVISNALLLKIATRLINAQAALKAGEYEFPAHAPMAKVLQMLRDGEVYDRKFTIPEGLTSHQIIKIINKVGDLEGEIASVPEEGSLLPETYHFVTGETKEDKVREMQTAMQKTLDELWLSRAPGLPFNTKEEALTLASIVEKETGVASERNRIAGVFVNRLRKGIPLQTDPTVIYAITKGDVKEGGKGPLGRRLLLKDLEIDNPYNTYKNAGLPPGPICNPGRAAIEATLNPEQHDYIYFVADGTGGHVFSKTLSEHNKKVADWKKIRRSQNR